VSKNDGRGADRKSLIGTLFRRSAFIVVAMGLFSALVILGNRHKWFTPRVTTDTEISTIVTRSTLPIMITAGGELESAETADVFSEVEGQQIKIVQMLPEGTSIEQGNVVMMLDPSDVKRQLNEQEIRVMKAEAAVKMAQQEVSIQQNVAQGNLARAELARTLAKLDHKKYLQGDHQIALNDLKGQIALAEAGLQESQVLVEAYEKLVKKGFRTPEQMRAKEQDLARAQYALNRDQEKFRVLENFTFERQSVELAAKAQETERELERLKSNAQASATKAKTDLAAAEATLKWEKSQLGKFTTQLASCEVRAPRQGIVVYAKQEGKRVELGATVHFKQHLFSIPDMTQMQVKAFVHESALRRIEPGQKAEVRIEAFPDVVMTGTVDRIDSFYDSVRHWMSGGVKEYAAIVRIDSLGRNVSPKPGMTASTVINAGNLTDALVVPLPAITEHDGVYYCYVVTQDSIQRREVTLGDNTDTFVEITDGLNEGERVALNARARALAETRNTLRSIARPEEKTLAEASTQKQ
jgi:HlyD family secretion protein